MTILLVLADFVIGLACGIFLTFTFVVLPLRTKLKEFVDVTLEFTKDQTIRITELAAKILSMEEREGSIISPIQIKKK